MYSSFCSILDICECNLALRKRPFLKICYYTQSLFLWESTHKRGSATWYTTRVSSTDLTAVLCDPLLL
jgi:hypothetical protein